MTIVNRQYGYVFIHVPKSAGKSVKEHLLRYSFSAAQRTSFKAGASVQALSSYAGRSRKMNSVLPLAFGPGVEPELGQYCRRRGYRTTAHLTALELREALGQERFDEHFSFAFTRNPWDRCLSAYFYFKRKRLHPMHALAINRPFPEFLLQLEAQDAAFIGNQTRWLYDEEECRLVSFIGRVEQIAEHMEQISSNLRYPMPNFTARVNVSEQRERDYRRYYTNGAIDTVARMMSLDVRLLGYEFE